MKKTLLFLSIVPVLVVLVFVIPKRIQNNNASPQDPLIPSMKTSELPSTKNANPIAPRKDQYTATSSTYSPLQAAAKSDSVAFNEKKPPKKAKATQPGQIQSPQVNSPAAPIQATLPASTAASTMSFSSTSGTSGTSTSAGDNENESLATETAVGAADVAGADQSGKSVELPVPVGARVPVAFLDEGERTTQQQIVFDSIQNDFTQAVLQPEAVGDEREIWQKAQQRADERYRLFFGEDAMNRLQLEAAREALKEITAPASSSVGPVGE